MPIHKPENMFSKRPMKTFKPDWDGTTTDHTIYKPTSAELQRRRLVHRSQHRDIWRGAHKENRLFSGAQKRREQLIHDIFGEEDRLRDIVKQTDDVLSSVKIFHSTPQVTNPPADNTASDDDNNRDRHGSSGSIGDPDQDDPERDSASGLVTQKLRRLLSLTEQVACSVHGRNGDAVGSRGQPGGEKEDTSDHDLPPSAASDNVLNHTNLVEEPDETRSTTSVTAEQCPTLQTNTTLRNKVEDQDKEILALRKLVDALTLDIITVREEHASFKDDFAKYAKDTSSQIDTLKAALYTEIGLRSVENTRHRPEQQQHEPEPWLRNSNSNGIPSDGFPASRSVTGHRPLADHESRSSGVVVGVSGGSEAANRSYHRPHFDDRYRISGQSEALAAPGDEDPIDFGVGGAASGGLLGEIAALQQKRQTAQTRLQRILDAQRVVVPPSA